MGMGHGCHSGGGGGVWSVGSGAGRVAEDVQVCLLYSSPRNLWTVSERPHPCRGGRRPPPPHVNSFPPECASLSVPGPSLGIPSVFLEHLVAQNKNCKDCVCCATFPKHFYSFFLFFILFYCFSSDRSMNRSNTSRLPAHQGSVDQFWIRLQTCVVVSWDVFGVFLSACSSAPSGGKRDVGSSVGGIS